MTVTSPRAWNYVPCGAEYLVSGSVMAYYRGAWPGWAWSAGAAHGITDTEQAARDAVEAAVDGRQMEMF